MCPGMTSFCAETTATSGRSSSSSVSPSALRRLRWGARANPFFTASLRILLHASLPVRRAFLPARSHVSEMRGKAPHVARPSKRDARNGGSGAAYWRRCFAGIARAWHARVQPSCSRVCSRSPAAGSHAAPLAVARTPGTRPVNAFAEFGKYRRAQACPRWYATTVTSSKQGNRQAAASDG